MRPARGRLGGALAFVLLMYVVSACRKPETASRVDEAAARRGRSLFQRGVSARGQPLVGLMGPGQVELSGPIAACARCHGPSGRGNTEGSVLVPDIRPQVLAHPRTRAAGDVDDNSRPAYTREALLRAITQGVDAAGRTLRGIMPRYVLSEVEREELISYLQQLGVTAEPGVTATTLTVGAALPGSGELKPMGQAVEAVLRAALGEVNARGGVFRRRLELRVEDEVPVGSSQAYGATGTMRLLEGDVLALVGSLKPEQQEFEERVSIEGVPLVFPLELGSPRGAGDTSVFFLYQQEADEARFAVQHLWHQDAERGAMRHRPLAVVHEEGETGTRWAQAARKEVERRELAAPLELIQKGERLEAMELEKLLAARPVAVLYAGTPGGLKALVLALEARQVAVPIIAPSGLANSEAGGRGKQPVLFVYPPGVQSREEHFRTFGAFLARNRVQLAFPRQQLEAYAAVQVLVEALSQTGVEVTRADLLMKLEELRDFDTGVTPPVSFGSSRRTAVQGAQLIRFEGQRMVAASEWKELLPE